jgi:hypothetical protein
MSREMSKEGKKLSVAQVQREMRAEKNRVRDKAGKTKLPLNLIWRKYIPLKFKLERYERLQRMCEMASEMVLDINVSMFNWGVLITRYQTEFGDSIFDDWSYEGVVPGSIVSPGTFIAKEDTVKRKRAHYFGQLEKVLKQPGSAQLRAWLKKRDTYYDVYGRPKIK